MQLVHNTLPLLSLSPHAVPLLQHGIPLMGYNPSWIASAWVFSKGYSPSGVDCSSKCLLQTTVSAGSLLQHELSMVCNFLQDTSACWGICPSMGHRLDVFSAVTLTLPYDTGCVWHGAAPGVFSQKPALHTPATKPLLHKPNTFHLSPLWNTYLRINFKIHCHHTILIYIIESFWPLKLMKSKH